MVLSIIQKCFVGFMDIKNMTYTHPKIRKSAYYGVIGIDNYVDFKSVNAILDAYLSSQLPRLNIADLHDWKLILIAVYKETDFLGVCKRPCQFQPKRKLTLLF